MLHPLQRLLLLEETLEELLEYLLLLTSGQMHKSRTRSTVLANAEPRGISIKKKEGEADGTAGPVVQYYCMTIVVKFEEAS